MRTVIYPSCRNFDLRKMLRFPVESNPDRWGFWTDIANFGKGWLRSNLQTVWRVLNSPGGWLPLLPPPLRLKQGMKKPEGNAPRQKNMWKPPPASSLNPPKRSIALKTPHTHEYYHNASLIKTKHYTRIAPEVFTER